MKDLKYLLAYSVPFAAFLSVYFGGYWSLGAVYFAFGLIPILEIFLPQSTENHSDEAEPVRLSNRFFDILLYLNIPILYSLIAYILYALTTRNLSVGEQIGMIISVGITIGSNGINVAHELGHRDNKFEQLLSKILLLPALYLHFFVEHNRGHHKNIATDLDPASSKLNETVYSFWIRSVFGGYMSAWRIEAQDLKRDNINVYSMRNQMIVFQLIQIAYLAICFYFAGLLGLLATFVMAIIGFLMLETVNYIEHYGLRRKLLPNGRYEQVMPHHSWNSDHEVGRIILYELTRHSDHHYKASRKYQILQHHEQAPQLPFGYPAAMLLSLIPPVWFSTMNPRVEGLAKHTIN
jgi:alkane 1-monooxygenase